MAPNFIVPAMVRSSVISTISTLARFDDMMTGTMKTDRYADWLTKAEAAQLLGISERTLERLVARGEVQQAARRIPGRKPLVVLHPGDVEKIRQETAQPAFVVPEQETALTPASANRATLPPGPGLVEMLVLSLQRQEQAAQRQEQAIRRYLTLPEAADYVGLPQSYLRRLIADGQLEAIKAGGWRVRRIDLDKL